jgi:hypothetical protein
MKPKVFLSHSKKDKLFVEKIANNLKTCGVNVWYDEWEIPPGESIRKKIFEDGITSCDLFFIYLTANSIPSYWVQKELDGALIHEIEIQDSFMALFVDKDDSRTLLSLDLKSLNIPVFNDTEYLIPYGKLLSKIWKCHHSNQLRIKEKDSKIKILELEKFNMELQKDILQIQSNSKIDVDAIQDYLLKFNYEHNNIKKNIVEILIETKQILADGCNKCEIMNSIVKLFNAESEERESWGNRGGLKQEEQFKNKYKIFDFTGELILKGLLEVNTSKDLDKYYYLTKQGIEFLNDKTIAKKELS